ncbi:uncharacterized protein LOC121731437 [Aricia agestis]|uniref:uncharacterized protein LOC121731437 n=1 Tax=Aricia agestis TaxID=91739 RepID=UPI001C209239|nr:uncharacterized protein LOC121731437 [Aricia agestis]
MTARGDEISPAKIPLMRIRSVEIVFEDEMSTCTDTGLLDRSLELLLSDSDDSTKCIDDLEHLHNERDDDSVTLNAEELSDDNTLPVSRKIFQPSIIISEDKVDSTIKDKVELSIIEDRVLMSSVEDRIRDSAIEDRTNESTVDDRALESAIDDRVPDSTIEERAIESTIYDRGFESMIDARAFECTIEDKVLESNEDSASLNLSELGDSGRFTEEASTSHFDMQKSYDDAALSHSFDAVNIDDVTNVKCDLSDSISNMDDRLYEYIDTDSNSSEDTALCDGPPEVRFIQHDVNQDEQICDSYDLQYDSFVDMGKF